MFRFTGSTPSSFPDVSIYGFDSVIFSGCLDVRFDAVIFSGCFDLRFDAVIFSGCFDLRFDSVIFSGCFDLRFDAVIFSGCFDLRFDAVIFSGCPTLCAVRKGWERSLSQQHFHPATARRRFAFRQFPPPRTTAAPKTSAPPHNPGISSLLSGIPPNATAAGTAPSSTDASDAASRDTSRKPPQIPARPRDPAAG